MDALRRPFEIASALFVAVALPFVTFGGITVVGLPAVAYYRRRLGETWPRKTAAFVGFAFLGLLLHGLLAYVAASFLLRSDYDGGFYPTVIVVELLTLLLVAVFLRKPRTS